VTLGAVFGLATSPFSSSPLKPPLLPLLTSSTLSSPQRETWASQLCFLSLSAITAFYHHNMKRKTIVVTMLSFFDAFPSFAGHSSSFSTTTLL
jgi:hypothetical protein